jgi:hypothetical protein
MKLNSLNSLSFAARTTKPDSQKKTIGFKGADSGDSGMETGDSGMETGIEQQEIPPVVLNELNVTINGEKITLTRPDIIKAAEASKN